MSSYYYVCVLVLLYVCPHTTICVCSGHKACLKCDTVVSSSFTIALLLLYYYFTTALLQDIRPVSNATLSSSGDAVRLAGTIYASAYYYICVLVLLYVCPHTVLSALQEDA